MIDNIKYKSNELPPLCNLRNLRNLRIKNKNGFTLIEIIIVIIVLAILSIFGFHFLSTGIHTYSMMEKQKGLFDQATMVMERISRELRDAESISAPTSDGNPYSTLTFTKSHGTLEETTTYVITFQLSGTTLQRVGTTTVTLADNVSTFTVARVTPTPPPVREEITITLTLQEAGAGAGEVTLRSYICPKNLAYPNEEKPSGRNFGGHWQENFQS
ncbi:MAG: prepilin-type N-terminal cleavage/methylation domain-containing protein [Proteobacteria bacterium]|nr:prepilin-type N-terminal cleavage/methylation domain-containing protein [Desulfobacteraceae bacterium]MBU4012896.1 prepilin-type N-terminal cleavage/methylation domain-containing protein [Pseudomonadota bacterium]MBU4100972.1 prepilin-type N-terminal cleavage/methylation domain-containing protein [Pseudomonadota bacterium]MBU4128200.1 prepilin-type N-terminal cleavage/methylation domain-containing protein [Pseudomonadota bacterium]